MREEIKTRMLNCGKRTYFFDVKKASTNKIIPPFLPQDFWFSRSKLPFPPKAKLAGRLWLAVSRPLAFNLWF